MAMCIADLVFFKCDLVPEAQGFEKRTDLYLPTPEVWLSVYCVVFVHIAVESMLFR